MYNKDFNFLFIYLMLFQIILKTESSLKCTPDFKSKGDNYSSINDPQDNFEYFYGYEFAHRAGGEYYDHWKGIYWDNEPFCYDAYDNFTRPEKLSDIEGYKISTFDVVTNLEDAAGKESYILIEHDQTNLVNFHKKMCMTNTHNITNYNHGEYELLIKMDNLFEEEYLNTPHHFIFTIENPSNETVTFSFKTRNFIYYSQTINPAIRYWRPNIIQATPPYEKELSLIKERLLNRAERYPIPEVFYFTNNYTIKPHQSRIINISLTFEKNGNEAKGGYFIISKDKGKSKEPFYWPKIEKDSGKLEKLTNMEIILESNLSVGLSSFSLMRRRDLEEHSYLGKKCNVKNRENVLNGKCGDGFYCNQINNECKQCSRKECKNCESASSKCTECFIISVDGQWNPPVGKGTDLNCDLDYIDITKIIINGNNKIEVPPAIHWRVTMDFWIWISDTSVLSDSEINMNIVYKDFMAFTLRCFPEGLRIYATPIEWIYEYPTMDGYEKYSEIYNNTIERLIRENVVNFLKNTVGSYDEVTIVDLVKNATSNWVYIRYAFNLDSSKHYLNDLPESNLKVAQIYKDQTRMPFHLKKFYGKNKMTYLYFDNFYHPLTEEQEYDKKNITIYLRNLNIFREYIPQNIITKYFNLYSIDSPLKFPQLLASFPFSNLTLGSTDIYIMKGYNYFVRKDNGEVLNNQIEIQDYELILDNNLKTLRPPRNFWRLNLLELNKQPETCDFDEMIDLKCDIPNEVCFEDNKAFICIEGTDEQPYYLDINDFECKDHCEMGYIHPPRDTESLQRLYCSHKCDINSHQCPSDNYKYKDIHSNFLCSNNFFNLYYKCFSKDEDINNAEYSGIFFSSFLRTPSIYIELPTQYQEFAIDFWYFPDFWLRNRRYLDTSKNNYNPKVISNINEKNKIIFLSDCCKIVFGSNRNDIIKFYVNKVETSAIAYPIPKIQNYNWNHFIFIYFKRADGTFSYYLTFKNDQYSYSSGNNKIDFGYWNAPPNVFLNKIIFCTKEENEIFDDYINSICKNAEWLDGFYRKLQIFDIKYSSRQPIFFAHEFEDDGLNGFLKHRYIFGLNSVIDNHLIDLIGNANGYVPSLYSKLYYQNPDGTNFILYESNYSPQGGIPNFSPNSYISDIWYIPLKIYAFPQNIDNKCSIAQWSGVCLKCKKGYSLFDLICKGNSKLDTKTATYYYKNPGKNMQERLSLNLNFNKITNEPYFTLFFFIKIYGFVNDIPDKGPVKLLIFHQDQRENGIFEDVFYLAYNHQDGQKLYFYVNDQVMFSISEFREYYFGIWIPISFTAFREEDRRFKMNMVQASMLYTNIPLDSNYRNDDELFPYVKFTQFTITNNWVGLLSDIKIYNKFIINTWGIIQHQFQSSSNYNNDVGAPIEEIDLKSDSPELCLSSNQILNIPGSGYKIECVADYNPHFSKDCKNNEVEITSYNQQTSCSNCCSDSSTYPRNCLSNIGSCGTVSEYYSCENQIPKWRAYYPFYNSDRRILCRRLSFIDYNRYKYAKAENVDSPRDAWSMDFWFLTSTNQAVKDRGQSSSFTSEGNNNNFEEFVIEWNYHNKIKVYKEVTSEIESFFNYKVECTPLIVVEHPDLTSDEIYIRSLGDVHYQWSYISCGVNYIEKNFFYLIIVKFLKKKILNPN